MLLLGPLPLFQGMDGPSFFPATRFYTILSDVTPLPGTGLVRDYGGGKGGAEAAAPRIGRVRDGNPGHVV